MGSREIERIYRNEHGLYLIEIRLRDLDQFFNSFDPSPFHDKDIDDDAERYIVNSVRSFRLSTKLKLVFYVPQISHKKASEVLPYAIDNYFDYRAAMAGREMHTVQYEGGLALIMGLVFLAVCMGLQGVLGLWPPHPALSVLREGLIIVGWVAMWRPIQIFLYDWWALFRMRKVYEKIRDMPIEVVLE